jgi:hypothetical protein
MSNDKNKKLINGAFSLSPKSEGQFLQEFLYDEDTFVDRWQNNVRKSYEVKSKDISKPIVGLVVRVEVNGKPQPGGFRSRINSVSTNPVETCLKVWVRTSDVDSFSPIPENFVNPGEQQDLVDGQFIYEAENAEIDLIVPKPGDFVNVIHPWAWGMTNKVGVYLGIVATNLPPSKIKTSSHFNKNNERTKDVT